MLVAYDYKTENQKVRAFVEDLSLSFKSKDAVLVGNLSSSKEHATGDHYTFSAYTPELRHLLEPITNKLISIDPSLVLNEPDLYHLTIFWCPINNDVDSLVKIFRAGIAEEPLSFNFHGLIVAPFGIGFKAYPLNNGFVRLREKLYAASGVEIPRNPDGTYHERFVSTWITLARYSEPPTETLFEYARSNLDLDLGVYTPGEIGVYVSDNKFLRNPKTVDTVANTRT